MNALSDPNARQGEDGSSQLLRQHDRPLALVVAGPSRSLPTDEFDVREHSLAIECLPDIHPALPLNADRAVVEEMPQESCEGERPQPLGPALHRELELPCAEDIARLVVLRLIQRRLEARDNAVNSGDERVCADPPTVGGEDLVIGSAHELPPVLQDERDAFARSLRRRKRLTRDGE